MTTAYETDVVAWAEEQATLLRDRNFSALDIEHIADVVADVGKSEGRELATCFVVLLSHLLKWRVQPERRGNSWLGAIKEQRAEIADLLEGAPSLEIRARTERWMARTWTKAVGRAMRQTGAAESDLPADCPWTWAQILDPDFLPG